MHDSSSAVGVRFLGAGKGFRKNQRLGCVIVAGHGVVPAFPHRATLENPPSVTPVALQAKPAQEKEERMRPPQKEEVEREAARFQEHMKGQFEREGGRHKDCGPRGKDD
jgi:hypothetical protein